MEVDKMDNTGLDDNARLSFRGGDDFTAQSRQKSKNSGRSSRFGELDASIGTTEGTVQESRPSSSIRKTKSLISKKRNTTAKKATFLGSINAVAHIGNTPADLRACFVRHREKMKNKLHEFLRVLKQNNQTKRDLTLMLKIMNKDIREAPTDIMDKYKKTINEMKIKSQIS